MPLAGLGVMGATVGGQPTADGAHSGDGYARQWHDRTPAQSLLAGRFSWSRTTLPHGSACTRSDTPSPIPLLSHPSSQATNTTTPGEKTSVYAVII